MQVNADAANMAFRMEVGGEHIRQAEDYLDFSSTRIQIFGSPSEEILARPASWPARASR